MRLFGRNQKIPLQPVLLWRPAHRGRRVVTGRPVLIVFHNRELGFTIATGALGACVVDMPGPLKYKHNEMLACTVIGFLSALATGIATVNPVALWCTVVPLTFVLSLIVVYGNRWPQISFATLFMMIMTLEEHFTPMQALVNASWILLGGLWYTYWSTFVSRWLMHRIEQQALAESVFACADYLLARADFYDLDNDLDECYRNLVDKQIAAVERQDAARDIVLRNLPKLKKRQARAAPRHAVQSVHQHGRSARAVRRRAYRLPAGAQHLRRLGHADVLSRPDAQGRSRSRRDRPRGAAEPAAAQRAINVKAELRAIEFEIELMRKHGFAGEEPGGLFGGVGHVPAHLERDAPDRQDAQEPRRSDAERRPKPNCASTRRSRASYRAGACRSGRSSRT